MVPQWGPYGEGCSVSTASGLFIHSYLSKSPLIKELSHEVGGNLRSPSMELHAGGRPTYNGVRPGSPRGSFTTLLSLPQCQAAFSTIPSTLVWVSRDPLASECLQGMSSTPVTASHVNKGTDLHVTLRYGRGV